MTARTDVHRPSAMDPADYVLVGYADSHEEKGYTEWRLPEFYGALGLPINPEATSGTMSLHDYVPEAEEPERWFRRWQCAHCGHPSVRYWTMFVHKPTGQIVAVGRDCAQKMGLDSRTQLEHQQEAERRQIKQARERWFATDDDRIVAFAWCDWQVEHGHYGYEGMRHKFVANVRRYGTVSDKFVRAMMRDMARTERREAEDAARLAAEAATASPVIEGRIEVVGTVLGTKVKDSQFGPTLKMLVRDDRGFKLWGTVPSALDVEKDDRIKFTATVSRSDDDEAFGFFSRPTKADYIEEVAA